jgi:3-methyladenine DNA glycosylase Mpg
MKCPTLSRHISLALTRDFFEHTLQSDDAALLRAATPKKGDRIDFSRAKIRAHNNLCHGDGSDCHFYEISMTTPSYQNVTGVFP